jgi:hypothetical protein
MPDKRSKKETVKQIQKEIEKLRDEYSKMELRPCRGDADLVERDRELEMLKEEIYTLEREKDKHLYTWWHKA